MMSFLRSAMVSIVIALVIVVAAEAFVRMFLPQNVRTTYLKSESLALRDPVLGHVNRPNAHARVTTPEFDVEYLIDESGFRRDGEPAEGTGSPDAVRILLLGDSFTFGASNDFDVIWAEHLRKRFAADGKDIKLINAGVFGYDTAQQMLYLERLQDQVRPDIVLVTLLPNDIFANEPTRQENGQEIAVGDLSAVVRGGVSKKSSLHTLSILKRLLMKNDRAYIHFYLTTPRSAFFQRPQSELFVRKITTTKSHITRMHDFAQKHGSKLLVLTVPQLFQVLLQANGTDDDALSGAMPDEQLADFFQQYDIPWASALDPLADRYRESGQIPYFRYDGHLNEFGNEIVGDVAYRLIAKHIQGNSKGSSVDNR